MSFRPVAVLVIVLVFAVAGCGGGKKKSAASATTAAGATTTSAAAAPSFASAKNCQQLAALGAKMSQALQASTGNGVGNLGGEANIFKALASAAPSEIRGDFETFAAAFSGYARALGNAGIKPGKTPTGRRSRR